MTLVHQFAIMNEDNIIYREVELDDDLVIYINDSLKWVKTYWNTNVLKKQGLDYYGYTTIRGEDIKKLKAIMQNWYNLFDEAPEKFFLSGSFLLEENRYEKNECTKNRVIGQLEKVVDLCDEAISKRREIIHTGI